MNKKDISNWSIKYTHSINIDHGDGVIRKNESKIVRLDKNNSNIKLNSDQKQSIENYISDILDIAKTDNTDPLNSSSTRYLKYSLSGSVPDEGGESEKLEIVLNDNQKILIDLTNGKSPTPPEPVMNLYKLVITFLSK